MNALLKGLLTATLVWLLMLAARRLGGRFAGLLTGLPTVSGPALLWMALDHGAAHAHLGATGAVVGTIACALFARVYAWAGTGSGALRAGACATATTVVAVVIGHWWAPSLLWAVPIAAIAVLGLQRCKVQGAAATRRHACASPLLTATVAGAITALVSFGCAGLSAEAGGLASSLPVIAAAVAVRQQRCEGPAAARCFLDGYLDGLLSRIVFTGTFGFAVLALAWPIALAIALLASTGIGVGMPALRTLLPWRGLLTATKL
jgi:hypothetical protein